MKKHLFWALTTFAASKRPTTFLGKELIQEAFKNMEIPVTRRLMDESCPRSEMKTTLDPWACPKCTFKNVCQHGTCEMCFFSRPQDNGSDMINICVNAASLGQEMKMAEGAQSCTEDKISNLMNTFLNGGNDIITVPEAQSGEMSFSWACAKCTYENTRSGVFCEMCESTRPGFAHLFFNDLSDVESEEEADNEEESEEKLPDIFSCTPELPGICKTCGQEEGIVHICSGKKSPDSRKAPAASEQNNEKVEYFDGSRDEIKMFSSSQSSAHQIPRSSFPVYVGRTPHEMDNEIKEIPKISQAQSQKVTQIPEEVGNGIQISLMRKRRLSLRRRKRGSDITHRNLKITQTTLKIGFSSLQHWQIIIVNIPRFSDRDTTANW